MYADVVSICLKISRIFNPFMYMSLPLLTRTMIIYLVRVDSMKRIEKVSWSCVHSFTCADSGSIHIRILKAIGTEHCEYLRAVQCNSQYPIDIRKSMVSRFLNQACRLQLLFAHQYVCAYVCPH